MDPLHNLCQYLILDPQLKLLRFSLTITLISKHDECRLVPDLEAVPSFNHVLSNRIIPEEWYHQRPLGHSAHVQRRGKRGRVSRYGGLRESENEIRRVEIMLIEYSGNLNTRQPS